ncbi:MAG TPA: MFS transporter, partial [Clostridia bacterium]|nr:MFS transporter [Clostridia bacterium]
MKKRLPVLAPLLTGVFMGGLDMAIVAPAFPAMARDLSLDARWSVWVVTFYALFYTMAMPLVGKISDRIGRKTVFTFSVAIFGLGSLLCGLATSLPFLLFGRAIQAVGAGGILPVAVAELGDVFPPEKRGSALGLMGATMGMAMVIGPNIGGFITGRFSWHWAFLINLPISVLILFMARGLSSGDKKTGQTVDYQGAILLSIILFSLMSGLGRLDSQNLLQSIFSPATGPYLAASIIFFFPFLYVERKAADPIIDLAFFRNRQLVLAFFFSIVAGLGTAAFFFIPAFSQTLLGLSTERSGNLVTPLAIAMMVAAPLGGMLLDRYGSRQVLFLGSLLAGAGMCLLAIVANSLTGFFLVLLVCGLGMGMMMGAPINYLVINEVDGGQRGVALGVLNVFRMVGTIVGPTIAGSILASAESQLPLAIEKTLTGKAVEMGELTRVAKMVSEQGLSFGGRISPDWLNGLTPEL